MGKERNRKNIYKEKFFCTHKEKCKNIILEEKGKSLF